jgi:hypothetical protein
MSGGGSEIGIAVAVVVVILILLGIFIGLILYFGCAIVCCCHNEKYDVCEKASQDRARKRGTVCGAGAGNLVEGIAQSRNPLERMDTSVLGSPVFPMTPMGVSRETCVAHTVEGIQVCVPTPQENEVSAFKEDNAMLGTEAPAVAVVVGASADTDEASSSTSATMESPANTHAAAPYTTLESAVPASRSGSSATQ